MKGLFIRRLPTILSAKQAVQVGGGANVRLLTSSGGGLCFYIDAIS